MRTFKSMVKISITDQDGTVLDMFVAGSFSKTQVQLADWVRDRVALNVDLTGDTRDDILKFLDEYNNDFPSVVTP